VTLQPGDIRAAATPSLFGDSPVVVVVGLDRLKKKDDDGSDPFGTARAELLDYVARPDSDAVVVLVHGGGPVGRDIVTAAKKAGATTVDVSSPPKSKGREVEAHRRQFVVAELDRLKLRVTPQAADLLVVAVGSDLRSLAGACSQLAADANLAGGSRVDVDLVGRYYGGRAEVDAFGISDHLMRGRTAQALALLRQMLGNEPLQKVGPMLVGGIAWRVRQRAAQRPSDGWTPEALSHALAALAAADAAIKGGEADAEYALERMLITIGGARTART
jgi:DNA polymerase-3 subunit delta